LLVGGLLLSRVRTAKVEHILVKIDKNGFPKKSYKKWCIQLPYQHIEQWKPLGNNFLDDLFLKSNNTKN